MTDTGRSKADAAARAMILPLALAQFIASYAATNMNVAISAIAHELGTTGAVLSAAGLFFVVLGLLQSRTYGFLISRQAFKIGSTVVLPKGSISPVWIFRS